MKKLFLVITLILAIFVLGACGNAEPDYSTAEAEQALNDGEDITGKTVEITVNELVPASAFGYNIQTGEHLNFVSESNPKVEKGETLVVEVVEVTSIMGSYVITYKK